MVNAAASHYLSCCLYVRSSHEGLQQNENSLKQFMPSHCRAANGMGTCSSLVESHCSPYTLPRSLLQLLYIWQDALWSRENWNSPFVVAFLAARLQCLLVTRDDETYANAKNRQNCSEAGGDYANEWHLETFQTASGHLAYRAAKLLAVVWTR